MILDGGLSNALAARGHDLSGALWTASLLRDDPAEIAAVHRAYFDAGTVTLSMICAASAARALAA